MQKLRCTATSLCQSILQILRTMSIVPLHVILTIRNITETSIILLPYAPLLPHKYPISNSHIFIIHFHPYFLKNVCHVEFIIIFFHANLLRFFSNSTFNNKSDILNIIKNPSSLILPLIQSIFYIHRCLQNKQKRGGSCWVNKHYLPFPNTIRFRITNDLN